MQHKLQIGVVYEAAVTELGFLPFFENSLTGFSIEEHVDPGIWFTGREGPWEWKGPVITDLQCGYGKFFEKKAAYISPEWFIDFANYRRDGYDFDARFEDGLVYHGDKTMYDLIDNNAPILSKRLKRGVLVTHVQTSLRQSKQKPVNPQEQRVRTKLVMTQQGYCMILVR
jgi:hypothetical protein